MQPAIETIFKEIPHGNENAHILTNLAEPIALAPEKMKIILRQRVREFVNRFDLAGKKGKSWCIDVYLPDYIKSELETRGTEAIRKNV